MSKCVYLVGAEDVSNAARTMSSAASEMMRAVSVMECALSDNARFMNDWLDRFEAIMKEVSHGQG